MNAALRMIGRTTFHAERSVLIRLGVAAVMRAAVRSRWSHAYTREAFRQSGSQGWGLCAGLSFDCDLPDDITAYPWLLGRLKEYGLHGSFACIGRYVEMYPEEHGLLVDAGHEIVNHTFSHPSHRLLNPHQRFRNLSDALVREEISRAHEAIEKTLGISPVGFRAPHFGGLHTTRVYPVLRDMGYRYSSSTIGTRTPTLGAPFKVQGIWELPLSPDPKTAFGCLETWGLYRANPSRYADKHEFLSLLDEVVAAGTAFRAFLNFYVDPLDLQGDPGMCEEILSRLAALAQAGWRVGPYLDLLNSLEQDTTDQRERNVTTRRP